MSNYYSCRVPELAAAMGKLLMGRFVLSNIQGASWVRWRCDWWLHGGSCSQRCSDGLIPVRTLQSNV